MVVPLYYIYIILEQNWIFEVSSVKFQFTSSALTMHSRYTPDCSCSFQTLKLKFVKKKLLIFLSCPIKNLIFVLHENKSLAQGKNISPTPPSLKVKWSVPNISLNWSCITQITFMILFLFYLYMWTLSWVFKPKAFILEWKCHHMILKCYFLYIILINRPFISKYVDVL
jgi:hypothetical protein